MIKIQIREKKEPNYKALVIHELGNHNLFRGDGRYVRIEGKISPEQC